MNFAHREDAVIADKMVQALADKGNAAKTSVSISETEFIDILGLDLQNIRSILEIATRNQAINGFRAFIRTLSAIDTADDTNGFLRNGGFTCLWDEQNKERLFKEKVDEVNTSVKITNKTVIITSSVSMLAALISAIVAIQTCNKTNEVKSTDIQGITQQLHDLKDTIGKRYNVPAQSLLGQPDSTKNIPKPKL